MLPIECIVRGYLTGSAWKEYRKAGTMHGQRAARPACRRSTQLPEPVFTPSTKAETGPRREHLLRGGRRPRRRGDGRARPGTSRSSSTAGAPSWAAERGHHHRRHQVRARARRRRAGRLRRGADARLAPLLAGRRVEAGHDARRRFDKQPRARLPRGPRLGQDPAAAAAARRGRRRHPRPLRRGLRAHHRPVASPTGRAS